MSGLRVVCVTPHVPYAGVDHAGGAFLYRYLEHLEEVEGWCVELLAPGRPANSAAVDGCPVSVTMYPEREDPGLVTTAWRLARHGVNAPSPHRWVRDLPRELEEALTRADLIDLQWSESAALAPALRRHFPRAVVVSTAYDSMTQAVRRARAAASLLERTRSLLMARSAPRAEAAGLGASDLVTVFNPHDGAMVRALGVETPVEVLAPLVEVDPIVVPAPGSGRVLFVGAMWRSENDEAARWLLDAVMPEVWTRAPDTRVRIAGARPSSSLLARTDGRLEITGYLDDLATAYQDVAVVAVPLRRGAGLKFKTVEAQAYGFPTVTTTVGAEGVADVVPGMVAAVVDDAASFADALVSALAGRAAGPDVARVRAALDFGASVARHARRCEALVAARRCGPEA